VCSSDLARINICKIATSARLCDYFDAIIALDAYRAWLAGAFIAIPAVGVLSVLGALYALYLLFIGLPIVMQAPEEKAGDFALAAIGVASVIFIALALVAGAMTPRF